MCIPLGKGDHLTMKPSYTGRGGRPQEYIVLRIAKDVNPERRFEHKRNHTRPDDHVSFSQPILSIGFISDTISESVEDVNMSKSLKSSEAWDE